MSAREISNNESLLLEILVRKWNGETWQGSNVTLHQVASKNLTTSTKSREGYADSPYGFGCQYEVSTSDESMLTFNKLKDH